MDAEILAWVMLGTGIALIMIGAPVGIGLAGSALIFGLLGGRIDLISLFPDRLFSSMTTFELAAVTLFIFMGVVLERSGISSLLFESLRLMLGPVRGGLLLSAMLLATIFAACTGISGASVVAIGLIAMPTMVKYKYDKSLAAATICTGGGLGVIIPPSIMLVLYGPIAGLSVSDLFMAAIIPGLILSGLYLTYIAVRCWINPELGPPVSFEERAQTPLSKLFLVFLKSFLPTALLIFGVLGSILIGYASPTEAAGVGALLSLLICIYYGKLHLDGLREFLFDSIKICSMILFICVCAALFTTVFIGMGGNKLLERSLLKIAHTPLILLFVMLLIILILGCFMDWIAILYITAPLYRPIIPQVGWDPIWFAVLYCVTLQISYITPPFAYSIFYFKGIFPEIEYSDIYRGVVPFIILQVIGLIIVYYVPGASLWLPNLFK